MSDRSSDGGTARGVGTRAVHGAGRPPRPDFSPTVPPIFAASAFIYDEAATQDAVFGNEREGFVYSRYGNPTVRALEGAVATLEGTEDAVAFGSGMGAIFAAILLDARSGDRVVAAPDVYGATYAILDRLAPSLGIETTFVDFRDLAALERVVAEQRPKLIVCETMSNPLVRVADLAGIGRIANAAGAAFMVDNTFATPALVNPARFGADSVVHSATKFLAGHGDATVGVVATTRERAAELREITKLVGAVASPFDAWLALRGLRTLPIRMRQHGENAAKVASWLAAHPLVERVNYPGLDNLGPADGQFNDANRGGMLSFDIRGAGRDEVFRFTEALRLALAATTLGDVWSLVLYPANTSHRAVPPERRAEIGIGDGLVRLSVGLEDVNDLIADLDAALHAAVGQH